MSCGFCQNTQKICLFDWYYMHCWYSQQPPQTVQQLLLHFKYHVKQLLIIQVHSLKQMLDFLLSIMKQKAVSWSCIQIEVVQAGLHSPPPPTWLIISLSQCDYLWSRIFDIHCVWRKWKQSMVKHSSQRQWFTECTDSHLGRFIWGKTLPPPIILLTLIIGGIVICGGGWHWRLWFVFSSYKWIYFE